MADAKLVAYWSDWLVDAVATATQNRAFLRGDPDCDEIACEAIQLNGAKAITNALNAAAKATAAAPDLLAALKTLVERDDYHRQEGMRSYAKGSPTDRAFAAARAAIAKATGGST